MSRFESVPEDVQEFVERIKNDAFPQLVNASVLVLFDTKKRKSGGNYVLGRMTKSNDLIKHLTEDLSDDGVDYIIYLDQAVWNEIEEADKVRLVRHELCHCEFDIDSRANPYKIRDHEVQDFYSEIEFNREDPRWFERLGLVAQSIHEGDE